MDAGTEAAFGDHSRGYWYRFTSFVAANGWYFVFALLAFYLAQPYIQQWQKDRRLASARGAVPLPSCCSRSRPDPVLTLLSQTPPV